MEPPKRYGGKASSNKQVFRFFTKGVYSFRISAAAEKALLPIFSLVLGTIFFLETDDLRFR